MRDKRLDEMKMLGRATYATLVRIRKEAERQIDSLISGVAGETVSILLVGHRGTPLLGDTDKAAKLLSAELTASGWCISETIDGRGHYVRLDVRLPDGMPS
ncbi:MAG: hypothetical protein L0Y56_02375 [Nitrospira sp.]|nr:hypothetical protein [Nitrospira sp.]